jgi:hypothetical protein
MVAFLIHFKKRKLSVGTCAPELGSPRKRACFSAMLAPATGPRATREVRRDPRQPRGPSYRNETRRLARRSRGTPSRLQRRQGLARPDQRRTTAKVAAPNSAGLPEDRRGVRLEQRWLTANRWAVRPCSSFGRALAGCTTRNVQAGALGNVSGWWLHWRAVMVGWTDHWTCGRWMVSVELSGLARPSVAGPVIGSHPAVAVRFRITECDKSGALRDKPR